MSGRHRDAVIGELKREIRELEARLADLKARLPGHSMPPGMMAEWDDLDERLEAARTRLSALMGEGNG